MKTVSKEYLVLFNEITDASETLTKLTRELCDLSKRLLYAQQRAEELFIEEDNSSFDSGRVS